MGIRLFEGIAFRGHGLKPHVNTSFGFGVLFSTHQPRSFLNMDASPLVPGWRRRWPVRRL